jgi:polysaccharide deacetylase 2 family uncharacterized protein YibQ
VAKKKTIKKKKKFPRRKRKPAKTGAWLVGVIFAGLLIAVSLFLSLSALSAGRIKPGAEAAHEKPAPEKTAPVKPVSEKPAPEKIAPAKPIPEKPAPVKPAPQKPAPQKPAPEKPVKGTLVLVIDDAGNNLRDLEPFLRFPGPLTIAVLPGLPHSAEAARRIRAAGKEVFLHQPMESLGGKNPGPGALYTGMGEAEIRRVINQNLDEIWPVAGINNHEGSKVTEDGFMMDIVLSVCRERGIAFLDSRTTSETAAPLAARRAGMTIEERDVFLDNEPDKKSILRYLSTGEEKARAQGKAVMIGHVWSPELAAILTEKYSLFKEEGYRFSTVTQLKKVR